MNEALKAQELKVKNELLSLKTKAENVFSFIVIVQCVALQPKNNYNVSPLYPVRGISTTSM